MKKKTDLMATGIVWAVFITTPYHCHPLLSHVVHKKGEYGSSRVGDNGN